MEYFSWEKGPAVITPPVDDKVFGFFIPAEESDWVMATPSQIADFFVDGTSLTEAEFVKMFGAIDESLPKLPEIT